MMDDWQAVCITQNALTTFLTIDDGDGVKFAAFMPGFLGRPSSNEIVADVKQAFCPQV